ncbi:MAG TPA: ROK family glucokinase [Cerasibacillus sp.]|uniref:ROK family glucokinase n=1 Tax=Cerasibacillus sp. TaxID=2498711 RepID=UPI002F3F6E55
MTKIHIGIDIGGTSIKIGFIDQVGQIIHKWEIPTRKEESGIHIVQDIRDSIVEKQIALSIDDNQFVGIGVGAPGFIDHKRGTVHAVNIGWTDYQLKQCVQEKFNLPVWIENDANMAVLGENWRGAGNGEENVMLITLGTGVGGGVIANGELLRGESGAASEIGHVTVERNGVTCNCGREGCLETIASATGMVRQAKETIDKHPQSHMAQFYRKNKAISVKDLFSLAEQGEQLSQQIIDNTTNVLATAIQNMATLINPSRILIGGGVSNAGEALLKPLRDKFIAKALPRISKPCELKSAELGNDAGIIGAAYVVLVHSK